MTSVSDSAYSIKLSYRQEYESASGDYVTDGYYDVGFYQNQISTAPAKLITLGDIIVDSTAPEITTLETEKRYYNGAGDFELRFNVKDANLKISDSLSRPTIVIRENIKGMQFR